MKQIKTKSLLPLILSIFAFNTQIFAQQKPGDISPNAKYIDADHLGPFSRGAAIVYKASSFGLIDASGNFIVPYNKYKSITPVIGIDGSPAYSGIFLVNNGQGAINANGKLITETYPNTTWRCGNEDGSILLGTSNGTNYIYLDAGGRKYAINEMLQQIAEGIGVKEDGLKRGYKNLNGEWIVKPKYAYTEPFSEGMACVGNFNEFGEVKYGFIDRTGKEVIGLMYSMKPDNFHGGLARVEPKNSTEFRQAYIDKKGTIVKKMDNTNFYVYIGNGLYLSSLKHNLLFDSTGKTITPDELLQSLGLTLQPTTDKLFSISTEVSKNRPAYYDGKLSFARIFKQSGLMANFGYVNLTTRFAIEGTFERGPSLDFFDPISKLAIAKFNTTGKFDKTPLREGYVNEQGVFVIVKAEASKW